MVGSPNMLLVSRCIEPLMNLLEARASETLCYLNLSFTQFAPGMLLTAYCLKAVGLSCRTSQLKLSTTMLRL